MAPRTDSSTASTSAFSRPVFADTTSINCDFVIFLVFFHPGKLRGFTMGLLRLLVSFCRVLECLPRMFMSRHVILLTVVGRRGQVSVRSQVVKLRRSRMERTWHVDLLQTLNLRLALLLHKCGNEPLGFVASFRQYPLRVFSNGGQA